MQTTNITNIFAWIHSFRIIGLCLLRSTSRTITQNKHSQLTHEQLCNASHCDTHDKFQHFDTPSHWHLSLSLTYLHCSSAWEEFNSLSLMPLPSSTKERFPQCKCAFASQQHIVVRNRIRHESLETLSRNVMPTNDKIVRSGEGIAMRVFVCLLSICTIYGARHRYRWHTYLFSFRVIVMCVCAVLQHLHDHHHSVNIYILLDRFRSQVCEYLPISSSATTFREAVERF